MSGSHVLGGEQKLASGVGGRVVACDVSMPGLAPRQASLLPWTSLVVSAYNVAVPFSQVSPHPAGRPLMEPAVRAEM